MTAEQLDAIQVRITDCATYNFGMFNADKLAHEDAPALLAYAREQQARLDRVQWIVDKADMHGNVVVPVYAIRAALTVTDAS